jgi:hypothetical protein
MIIAPEYSYDTQAASDICLNCPLLECLGVGHYACPLRKWRRVHKDISQWWTRTEAG